MKKSHLVMYVTAYILLVASLMWTIYNYSNIADIVPTHFNIAGEADAWSNKSVTSVFSLPIIHMLIVISLSFIYAKPQYTNFPISLALMTLKKNDRTKIFNISRELLAITLLWISIMFSYIQYGVVSMATNNPEKISSIFMEGMVASLLIIIAIYSIKMFKVVKEIRASNKI